MNTKVRYSLTRAKEIFRKHGGILRTGEAIRLGIHPVMLYEMRDAGIIRKLSRGLYRLAALPPLSNLDIISVKKRVPNGVVCLISALAFHEITTQIPHEVYIAVVEHSWPPKVDYPPIRVFWSNHKIFNEGVFSPTVDGITVSIYNPERTIADCFKYRNKIGLNTAIEALKFYLERKRIRVDELIRFAKICRVEKVMRPYLEALI